MGEKSTANGKKNPFWKWIFFATLSFAIIEEIGSGRKRMWFNDCVVITFHSAVKPELMAYKKCGSVTTCSMEFRNCLILFWWVSFDFWGPAISELGLNCLEWQHEIYNDATFVQKCKHK